MAERPILFSGEMVRAILDGRKTQTRRVIKPQPQISEQGHISDSYWIAKPFDGLLLPCVDDLPMYCPYGQPGDLLWVRETWQGLVSVHDEDLPWSHVRVMHKRRENVVEIGYKADYPNPIDDGGWAVWVPSIHMPRWASRITLRVTDVRVERVQEISEADAKAEGCNGDRCDHAYRDEHGCTDCYGTGWLWTPQLEYMDLWNSINAARGFGWDANPWVWVVKFERLQP